MQVSTPTRYLPPGRQRAPSSDPVAAIADAVGLAAGQNGGQQDWSSRDERQTASERPAPKTGHKTVFVARALSSTLNQLQIASSAAEFDTLLNRASAATSQTGGLDALISNMLSAA